MSNPIQPPITAQERPLAQMYLNGEEFPQQQVWLTHQHIWVMRGELIEKILLSQVRQITFQHRRPLLPLIGGGAMLAFASLALFRSAYDPFLLLAFFFGSFFLFYFGINGHQVMSIEQEYGHYDVRIRETAPHHEAFARFTNTVLVQTQRGQQWWLQMPQLPADYVPGTPLETPKEGCPWLSATQLGQHPPMGSVFVKVDFAKAEGEFLPIAGGGLQFRGKLPTESILFMKHPPSPEGSINFT